MGSSFWRFVFLSFLGSGLFFGCNNAAVSIGGVAKLNALLFGASTTGSVGSSKVTISGGDFSITAQVTPKQQSFLQGGDYQIVVEGVQ